LQQIITVLVPSIGDGIGKIRTLHLVAIKKWQRLGTGGSCL
jgi:hypothetical protein